MIAGDDAVALVDGAGLRDASDPVERAGVALAVESAASADVLIAVVRADAPLVDQESTLTLAFNRASVHVVTMGDVADPEPVVAALARRGVPALVVARGDAAALDVLRRRVVAATPLGAPYVTAQPMPWLPRHVRALVAIRAALEAGTRAEAVRELDLLLGEAP
jgi:tRNA U34 5-carboxymethylaminomethyl modifying GTPase MnmE/TrmE